MNHFRVELQKLRLLWFFREAQIFLMSLASLSSLRLQHMFFPISELNSLRTVALRLASHLSKKRYSVSLGLTIPRSNSRDHLLVDPTYFKIIPHFWQFLLCPVLKGRILMPNPAEATALVVYNRSNINRVTLFNCRMPRYGSIIL